jgi:CRISPR-associated protein Cas2
MDVSEYLHKERLSGIYLLIIYDICHDANRIRFSKLMEGYGYRVQKYAFEAYLTLSKYEKLLKQIPKYIDAKVDSVRIYQLHGKCQIKFFGCNVKIRADETIIM